MVTPVEPPDAPFLNCLLDDVFWVALLYQILVQMLALVIQLNLEYRYNLILLVENEKFYLTEFEFQSYIVYHFSKDIARPLKEPVVASDPQALQFCHYATGRAEHRVLPLNTPAHF